MARKNIIEEMMLYDECFAALYRTAQRILRNQSDAEEVVHDAFMKYFSLGRSQKREITTPKSWLCKATIRRSIDFLRQKKLLTTPLEALGYKITDDDESTEEFSLEKLKEQIDKLPTIYAVVLKLKLFEGLDFEEIAGYLNSNESTVRSQYRRALQKLRHG